MSKELNDVMKKSAALSESVLEKVTGGVVLTHNSISGSGAADPQAKYREFELAYTQMGFLAHGFTRHQLDAMCDEWEAQGFPGSAAAFLARAKTW